MSRPSILTMVLFLSIYLLACHERKLIIPSEFIETELPKVGSENWFLLNYSDNEFKVENENGTLRIHKTEENNTTEYDLHDGKLIGINHGEFGGQLKFIPSSRTKNEVIIKGGNVKFIFLFHDKLYFIEGLAHMGYSGGGLYQLDRTNDTFSYEKILEFDDAPEAFTVYHDKFLIAAYESFYVIENFKKNIIFSKTFWSSLYPNSIAAFDDKNIFLGIRGGIVKLDLTTNVIKLYQNAK